MPLGGMEHNYKKLSIWKDAYDLCLKIYFETTHMPKEEKYGLTSQMRRGGVSIVSNISEGSASGSNLHFVRYLNISLGALCELETQLYIASQLTFMKKESATELLNSADNLKRKISNFKKQLSSCI